MFLVRTLLGKSIKSDEVIDVLESLDLKVEYCFDRAHEGIMDRYVIEAKKQGFCLVAGEDQVICTCFLYLRDGGGYRSISSEEDTLEGLGFPSKSGAFGGRKWVRYDGPLMCVHYEYDHDGPRMITVMTPDTAPG